MATRTDALNQHTAVQNSFAERFANVGKRFMVRITEYGARRALSQLSDQELETMGLTRKQIPAVAREMSAY